MSFSDRSNADKGHGDEAAVAQLNEFVLGDLIWVRLHGSYQRDKPISRSVGEVLVRLYGRYKYMYADPLSSC
ncbi:hypothetical protein CsSME_00037660 [Camellia sinensis var. sinensis]